IPNLLPSGVAAAVRDSSAIKILVVNLMTQPGETERYSAADHLKALQDYLGDQGVQICLLNSRPLPRAVLARYAAAGSEPVLADEAAVERRGAIPIAMDLLAESAAEIRHDSVKLARWIVALTRAFQRARDLRLSDVRCFAAGAESAAPL
ncbi:MAG: gluconeogenesis factor YvcK family protein, partial [Bryobacteraceae bacterium]